jgi:VanZ family protein
MSNPLPQGCGVADVRRPILNSRTAIANLISPLDVQCSMLDVRRFRADVRFQTSELWMKSFFKYWFPLLIWLVVIFVCSTSIMSADHTSRYIVPFLLWLKPGMSPRAIWIILITARKCAHVIEYAFLALLLWRALRSVPTLHAKSMIVFGAVLLGCSLFAVSDEFHQTFVKSRRPSVRDVLLDVTGALLGLLIGAIFARSHSRKFQSTTYSGFVDAKL